MPSRSSAASPGCSTCSSSTRSATRGSSTRPTPTRRERLVQEGEAAVAYLMRPTRIEDVFAYARRGEVLPQKTTYFFPKLISGLLFHPL